MVHIEWSFSNKRIIIGVILIVLILGLVVSISIILGISCNSTISTEIDLLRSIGQVRKSLNFLSYYSLRVLENSNDTTARNLLVQ